MLALDRLCVLSFAPDGNVAAGAARAHAAGLGALYLAGLDEAARAALPRDLRATLRRDAQRGLVEHAVEREERAALFTELDRLGVPAVLLKGRALAGRWPQPSLRPVGDLDLLVPADALDTVAQALVDAGLHRHGPEERSGLLRRGPTGIELLAVPPRRTLHVDLHARLFRSVGHRLDGAVLLARAREASLDGITTRVLDPADELLYVLVHAARHGLRAAKWLFDVAALVGSSDEATFATTAARARESGTSRPFAAALRVVARLPGVTLPTPALPAHVAPLVDRLLTVEDALANRPLAPVERYAIELLLEPGLAARARMGAGILERLAGRFKERR